jgi:hypothetical protein
MRGRQESEESVFTRTAEVIGHPRTSTWAQCGVKQPHASTAKSTAHYSPAPQCSSDVCANLTCRKGPNQTIATSNIHFKNM